MTYVIGWRSKLTNAKGQGSTTLPFDECKRICNEMDEKYPALTHFPIAKDNTNAATNSQTEGTNMG